MKYIQTFHEDISLLCQRRSECDLRQNFLSTSERHAEACTSVELEQLKEPLFDLTTF